MDNNIASSHADQYHTDIQSIIDSYVTSADNVSTNILTSPNDCTSSHCLIPNSLSTSTLITFNRDPALSENLTDEIRWILIQYGPYQPREDDNQFQSSIRISSNGKGTVRFRPKWFDDNRFSDWLEYSLSTCRAYCFYCRLFAESNRNRAFSRDGIRNWRKCLGSRGQKKKRSTTTSLKSNEDTITCQRRGLLESHAMSESHKQAYKKYLAFFEQMNLKKSRINNDKIQDHDGNFSETTQKENK